MKEPVVANQNIPHYLPKFTNPIYELAQKAKEELRQEKLRRIKTGNFDTGLYPLINNITLTEEELEDIFINWWLNGLEHLINVYGLALKNFDFEQIKIIDQMIEEESLAR